MVKTLAEATEALAEQKPGAANAVADTVRRITELYTSHIWKEDEMVFPMVNHLFSDEERTDLFEKFEKAEEDIGADHEVLAAFADALERKTEASRK